MKKKEKHKFFALSQFGLPGVSYRIQLGTVNGKWTLILLKGRGVIASQTYKGSEFPNRNELINWIISSIGNPNFDSYHIKKTVETMVDQAINKNKQLNFENKQK